MRLGLGVVDSHEGVPRGERSEGMNESGVVVVAEPGAPDAGFLQLPGELVPESVVAEK